MILYIYYSYHSILGVKMKVGKFSTVHYCKVKYSAIFYSFDFNSLSYKDKIYIWGVQADGRLASLDFLTNFSKYHIPLSLYKVHGRLASLWLTFQNTTPRFSFSSSRAPRFAWLSNLLFKIPHPNCTCDHHLLRSQNKFARPHQSNQMKPPKVSNRMCTIKINENHCDMWRPFDDSFLGFRIRRRRHQKRNNTPINDENQQNDKSPKWLKQKTRQRFQTSTGFVK